MCASPAALRRARELCRELEPLLAEMVERNDPSVEDLTFDDIEANSAAAGDVLARLMMLRALARQPEPTGAEIEAARREALGKAEAGLAAGKSPGSLKMKRRRDRLRRLGPSAARSRSRASTSTSPVSGRAFSPLQRRLGIPEGHFTPRVERHLMERVAQEGYRGAARSLDVFGLTVSHTEVGRMLERVGPAVRRELFGPEAEVEAATTAPPNAPGLLVIEPDGSRYRTNEADVPRRSKDTPPEDRGWRENKVGVVARMLSGKVGTDGAWSAPTGLVKTYVATTGDIHRFGRDLRTEAERRGVKTAQEVVCLSDHGHGIPGMFEQEFADVETHRITDFFHGAGRLGEVASVVRGDTDRKRRWKLFWSLRDDLWNGEVGRVARRLRSFASRLAPRPESLTELDSEPEARALWEHTIYIEGHADSMDYPRYRRKGWPIASGSVESACGRFGDRVKHARMRWTRERADAIHAVKAAIFSEDGRWDKRWPGPVPILEAPLSLVEGT